MARLACRCLNVTVHYKGLSWDARKVEGDHVLPAGCGHRLCGAVLHEVDLDLAGVTTVREGGREREGGRKGGKEREGGREGGREREACVCMHGFSQGQASSTLAQRKKMEVTHLSTQPPYKTYNTHTHEQDTGYTGPATNEACHVIQMMS